MCGFNAGIGDVGKRKGCLRRFWPQSRMLLVKVARVGGLSLCRIKGRCVLVTSRESLNVACRVSGITVWGW